MLCDSNVQIYAAEPDDTVCRQYIERDDASIASISRIEVLGFHRYADLPVYRQQRLQRVVNALKHYELTDEIILRAIELRQMLKIAWRIRSSPRPLL